MPSREVRPWDAIVSNTPFMMANERWSKLGWSALSKFVISAAAAAGTKLGEHVVKALLGDPKDDDRDDSDDGDNGDGEQ